MALPPDPLVPIEVDLTEFGFMPLDVRRLRDSRIAASASGDEFRAAVLLWCASWHQKPAASLPDDDIELAQLSGYGRVIKEWKKVRDGALHGWVKCTDGRLYHPVIAEKANEAWAQKLEHAWSRECDRVRKENKRRADAKEELLPLPPKPPRNSLEVVRGIPSEIPPSSGGIPAETPLKGEGEGKDTSKSSSLRSEGTRTPRDELLLVVDAEHADAVIKHRTKLRSSLTDHAARLLAGKLRQCGEANAAADLMIEKGWKSIEPEWFHKHRKSNGSAPTLPFNGEPKAPKDQHEAEMRLKVGRERQMWPRDRWGPAPGEEGCTIPSDLVQPSDSGWTEWVASG